MSQSDGEKKSMEGDLPSRLERFLDMMEGDDMFVLPHQREAVRFLARGFFDRRYCGRILNDAMGMGKTRSALLLVAFLAYLWRDLPPEERPVDSRIPCILVVARRDLLHQWAGEWAAVATRLQAATGQLLQRMRIIDSKDNRPSSGRRRKSELQVLARGVIMRGTTYHSLKHHLVPQLADSTVSQWTLVLGDEAHAIKKPSTKLYQNMEAVCSHRRVLLTGTLVNNDLEDLWAPLSLVHHPGTLPWATLGAFRRGIVKPLQGTLLKQKTGSFPHPALVNTARRELERVLNRIMLRREGVFDPEEGEEEGPAMDRNSVPNTQIILGLPLTPAQSALMEESVAPYCDKEDQSLTLDRRGALPLINRLRLLSQCAKMGGARSVASFLGEEFPSLTPASLLESSEKTAFVVRFLQSLLWDPVQVRHRVVVVSPFTTHLHVLEKCLEPLREEGLSVYKVHGDLPADERVHRLAPFSKRLGESKGTTEEDSPLSVLLVSTYLGSEGLNLTRSDILLNMCPTWRSSDLHQVAHRLIRTGQENPHVLVVHVVGAPSIEESMLCLQSFKEAQHQMLSSMSRPGETTSSSSLTWFLLFPPISFEFPLPICLFFLPQLVRGRRAA